MELTEGNRVAYLANLFAVARADGKLSAVETQFIDSVQKRIAAKKGESKKAEILAEVGSYVPSPVGPFSTRIANLEDMLAVSLVDGELGEREKPIILEFARLVGLTNDQLKSVLTEVRGSLASTKEAMKCPHCSMNVPTNAKFCSACGRAIETQGAQVSVEFSIPPTGVAIEFAESSAAGFADAVKIARAASSFAECVKSKKTWYLAVWPRDKIADAAQLVDGLKGIRNRKAWIDGAECKWDDIFGFVNCSQQRSVAFRPAEYCFGIDEKRLNIWGCINTQMDWGKWGKWFSYGKFRSAGLLRSGHVFVFDKQRIRHELQVNLFRYRFCPHLNNRLVEAVLEELPAEVEVSADGDWNYREDYEDVPGSIDVKLKVVNDGYSYVREFKSSGAEPKNSRIGVVILRRALQKCGAGLEVLKSLDAYRDR